MVGFKEYRKSIRAALFAAALFPLLALAKPERPDLILIIADDLGQQIGCYGDPNADTPNLDRMAAEGVMFRNAHVTAASCSPSRGSIMTGLYPHQHGMMGLSHFGTERMHDDVPKLPNQLKKLGYRTALIGKSHFQPRDQFTFDYYNEDMGHINRDRDVLWQNERAADFLDAVPEDTPFFLIVSYIDPHRGASDVKGPYGPGRNIRFPRVKQGLPADPPKPEDIEPFPFYGLDSPEIREELADFYGAVARLDIGVGDLREKLEARGVWDDSLILFIGDHGPDVTRGKMAVYEWATRVPFIVNAPGAPEGLVREELVSSIDLFPTFIDAASAGESAPHQGRSLLGLLREGPAPAWRRYLFTEYITHVPWHFYPRYTARDHRYKLILNIYGGERENPLDPRNYCNAWWEAQKPKYREMPIRDVYERVEHPPRVELYDLRSDPYEFTNLASRADLQGVRENMLTAIDDWRRLTDDPFLDPAEREEQDRKGLDYRKQWEKRRGAGH
ncbi:sulfatase [Kiritimatiella glycovorans]|uniref:Arylsulfatase n=1 Tax=Kiritimatiella glycovorans TaxID=1307763 RepID=A0A0G3EH13_9BACT|nr:sulfatase [Kiritimatiella glycovorans]AKJ63424.1 Arylsulfatase [Kiritimatiella glycovorans]